MTGDDERRHLDVIRYALGGATDEATRRIERGIGDAALAEDVDRLRRAAAVVRADHEGAPGPGVVERLLERAREKDAELVPPREEWLVATPITTPAGVRGPLPQDGALCLETNEFRLTVTLAPSAATPGLAAVGQITRDDGTPFEGVAVALLVDHDAVAEGESNALGEFSFPPVEGGEFALRLDAGYGPHFVLLPRDEPA